MCYACTLKGTKDRAYEEIQDEIVLLLERAGKAFSFEWNWEHERTFCISFSDFPLLFLNRNSLLCITLLYSTINDLRLKLSIRLYMLSPPREVRHSCEKWKSQKSLTTKGDRGMNSKEWLFIVNAWTVG